jgi:putative zinc finger protein
MTCEEARELAPELALGIATGEERADALRHLAGCAACRRALEELSEVADELLMLVPEHEPPAGFESGVLEGLGARVPRRRRARRIAMRVAAPVAAAAAAVAVMLAVFDDDRELASRYRDTLERADGQYFNSARLQGPGGVPAGVVFGYQGRPSWVLVVVDPEHRAGRYAGELVTKAGQRIPLRSFRLDPATGSWGRAIPMDLRRVSSVRLVDRRRGETLEAAFGSRR